MGRTPKYYPSFFKILMGDFATKLVIPGKFATRDLEGNPPAVVLIKDRNQNGSRCWPVKVKKTGDKCYNYSFIGSGWRKFVRECELKEKDFLVFTLIMNSVFEVVRFAPSGCEKGLISSPFIHELHHGSAVSQHIKENPAKACKRKSKDPLLPHPTTRRSRENVAEASGSDKQEEQDPSFTTVIREYHRSCLTLKKSFARETEMARKRSVMLRNEAGKKWKVHVLARTYPTADGRIDFGVGWPVFLKENNIADGDSCTFKFRTSHGDNMIDVVVHKGGRG